MEDFESWLRKKNEIVKMLLFYFFLACISPLIIYVFETAAKWHSGGLEELTHMDSMGIVHAIADSFGAAYVSTVVPAVVAFLIQYRDTTKSVNSSFENRAFKWLTSGSICFGIIIILRWILYDSDVFSIIFLLSCGVYTVFMLHWYSMILNNCNRLESWTPSG